MEEERRLAFVACTRAEKKLIITDAGGVQFGTVRYPSRFIFDIGLENLSCVVPLPDPLVKEAKLYAANADKLLQLDPEDAAFKNGDRVEHAWFGSGVIQETDFRKGYWIVRFDASGKERTIPFSMKEKLKRPE
jgi:DNA helicase-2/ATP-dependent DNA helicase PcrA